LKLHDLDGDEALTCEECDTSVPLERIRAILAGGWGAVLKWIDAAPVLPE